MNYHRLLNRAVWSPRAASRLLLGLLLDAFAPSGPVLLGIDETIERRRGRRIGGSHEGAENWAAIASLIETCKLNAVDPQRYLADLLTRLVEGWPQLCIDELMPWRWTTP